MAMAQRHQQLLRPRRRASEAVQVQQVQVLREPRRKQAPKERRRKNASRCGEKRLSVSLLIILGVSFS